MTLITSRVQPRIEFPHQASRTLNVGLRPSLNSVGHSPHTHTGAQLRRHADQGQQPEHQGEHRQGVTDRVRILLTRVHDYPAYANESGGRRQGDCQVGHRSINGIGAGQVQRPPSRAASTRRPSGGSLEHLIASAVHKYPACTAENGSWGDTIVVCDRVRDLGSASYHRHSRADIYQYPKHLPDFGSVITVCPQYSVTNCREKRGYKDAIYSTACGHELVICWRMEPLSSDVWVLRLEHPSGRRGANSAPGWHSAGSTLGAVI